MSPNRLFLRRDLLHKKCSGANFPVRGDHEKEAMGDEQIRDDLLLRIECGVREMPSLDPPPSLLPFVMNAVRTKKMPWWYRFYRWARAPRSITFTPLRIAPIVGVLMGVFVLSIYTLFDGNGGRSTQVPPLDGIPVTLSLTLAGAQRVQVVGSFNDWNAQGYEMRKEEGKELWTLSINLPRGRYEYAFKVDDDKIVPDPRAGFYQDDGFGNRNAVLIVGNHHEENI